MNGVLKILFLIVSTYAATTSGASAQSAPLICPKPGLTIHVSDGIVISAEGGQPPVCSFRVQSTGRSYQRYAVFFGNGDLRLKQCAKELAAFWPLTIGKKAKCTWSGASDGGGGDGTWFYSLTVEAYRPVAVKAGTFDAFEVVLRQEGAHAGSYRDELRYWYAPSVGYLVKVDWRMVSGQPPLRRPTSWEAVSVRGQ